MVPYYDHGGITIYHGDCREILPHLGRFDLLLADPPYGISLFQQWHREERGPAALDEIIGDDTPFDPAHLLALDCPSILWGANHYASRLPDSKGWLAWDKVTRNGLQMKHAEIEFAWSNCLTRPRLFRHLWSGPYRASETGPRLHPTQKPVALMSWCLGFFPEARTVVDPYMGSGPIAKACKDRRLRYVGIELDEKHCARAVKRLAQEVLF